MNEAPHTTTETLASKAERLTILRYEAAGMRSSEATWLAWYMCALSLAFAALGLFLLVSSRVALPGLPVFEQWAEDAVVAVGFSTLGAIVAPRFPAKNPIGWLFCAIGLVGAMLLFGGEYAAYSLQARPGSLPCGEVMAWIASWLWVVHIGLFLFLALLFPDGRPPTPRWRPFGWLVAAAVVVGAVAAAYSPGPIRGLGSLRNPLGIEGLPNLCGAVEVLVFVLALAASLSLAVRLRGARGVERQQIRWFSYAAAVAAVGAFAYYVAPNALSAFGLPGEEAAFATMMIGVAGLPVALGVAVLRYRLHHIDLIVSLTLVYGSLTAMLAGLFELNVVVIQHLALVLTNEEDSRMVYFATALVMAALFEPLKRRIDAYVERRFFRSNNRATK